MLYCQVQAPAALPPGKTRYPLYSRLDGPQGGKSRPPPRFDPRTVHPVASRYTDWAIPAHTEWPLSLTNYWSPIKHRLLKTGLVCVLGLQKNMFYLCKTDAHIFRRQYFSIFSCVVSASHRVSVSEKWLSGHVANRHFCAAHCSKRFGTVCFDNSLCLSELSARYDKLIDLIWCTWKVGIYRRRYVECVRSV